MQLAKAAPEVEFWQRILAAEIAPQKLDAVGRQFERFRSIEALWDSPLLTENERERARQAKVERLDELAARGVGIITRAELPERYRHASAVPPALFYWGDADCLQKPMVAIVGTRAASTYGKAVAQKFAEALGKAGVTIISGGALGIDAAAHKGALSVGAPTAAVLLTGIERVYPHMHRALFEQIKQQGCLLSQFAVDSTSNREYRPLLRNRTVAALSTAILVVEAPERSGALSTAGAANELGRQVFVVPANVDNVNYRGSHALIRDGATLVDHPDQILEALDITAVEESESAPLSPLQNKILASLGSTPKTCEAIVQATKIPTSELLSELTLLELEGRVLKDPQGYMLKP